MRAAPRTASDGMSYRLAMELIASLTPDACGNPLAALSRPPAGAAVVELRADLFPDLAPRSAVAACPLPILFTLRSDQEGGSGPSDPVQRRSRLSAAYEAGAALLDLELDRDRELMRQLGLDPERVILSWHQASGPSPDLRQVCERLLATPARWVKVVPAATTLDDLEQVLALHRRFNTGPQGARRLIAMATGTVGIASRHLAPLLGPPLTFVAWSDAAPAAPGQLTAARLQAVIGHLDGPPQRLFGVVGSDVSRSLSPAMHAAAYHATGLHYLFLPVSVPSEDELAQLFVPSGEGLFSRVGLDVGGWAVTTPYKAAAARAATVQAPRARAAAAANTLVLRPRQVLADNTDGDGVVAAARITGIDPRGRSALVQGTGGAARGAAVGLQMAGAAVRLRGREPGQTRRVADELGVDWCAAGELPRPAEILVNATPLGSHPGDNIPFTPAEVRQAALVVDLVYGDWPTPLAEMAAARGVPLVDGREVLAHQGYAQFAAFTGRLPPREAMRAAVALRPIDSDGWD